MNLLGDITKPLHISEIQFLFICIGFKLIDCYCLLKAIFVPGLVINIFTQMRT